MTATPLREKTTLEAAPPVTVSLMQHTLGFAALGFGGAIVCAYLLDLVGLPVRPWSVGLLVFLLVAFFGWNFWRKARQGLYRWGGWDFPELIGFAVVVLGFLAYALWLGKPNLLPVGTTVDAVHQYGLADYITQSGKLPLHATDQRPNLQDGLEYPPAYVIIVSLLSQTFGLDTIYLLYPVVAFFAALAAGATYAVVSLLLQNFRWRLALAGLAAACTLLPYGYTFGSFTSQNYFAQVTGEALLMLSLFFLLQWRQGGTPESLALLGITIAALIICYPTWAFIALAAFGLMSLFWQGQAWRKRLINLAILAIPLVLLTALFLKDRLATGLGTVANEGDVLLPDLGRYSWPVVILAAVGGVGVFFRGEVRGKIAALFCGLVALEGFGFWALKTWFGQGSYYSVYKLFYPAAYLFPVLAASGLYLLFSLAPQSNLFASFRMSGLRNAFIPSLIGIIVFGAVLAITWASNPTPQRPYPAITRDNLNVATWMKNNLKISEFSVSYNVQPGTPAYWLQVGIFKQPRGVRSSDILYQPPITFENWFYAPDSSQYLFTDDLNRINLDERIQVLSQSGRAAVLTRTPAYTQQLGQRPSLSLAYEAEHYENRFWIKVEATMSEEPSAWLSVGLEIEPQAGGAPVFQASIPAEKNRAKKQFLGITVRVPSFEFLEFYSNNTFPPSPKSPPALVPGKYSAYILLQKEGTTVERRKLNDFELNANNDVVVDPGQRVVDGQFVFEGTLPVTQPAPLNLPFNLNSQQFTLENATLPAIAKTNETVQLNMQWQISATTTHNYALRLVWLNESGEEAARVDTSPLNGLYPTWMWPSGKSLTIKQGITTPAKAGKYKLGIALVEGGQSTKIVVLDKFIEVS